MKYKILSLIILIIFISNKIEIVSNSEINELTFLKNLNENSSLLKFPTTDENPEKMLFHHKSGNLNIYKNKILKSSKNLPIAVFHGIGDNCDGWMKHWTQYLGNKAQAYSRCIESGADIDSELNSIQIQAETACKIINLDDNFQKNYIIVGFSQGGLIGRYVLEKCQTIGKVKKFISFGTPHMGISKIPCGNQNYEFLCQIGDFFARYLVFLPGIGRIYSPLSYVRDPHTEFLYKRFNRFLAILNNESYDIRNFEIFKKKFLDLEKIVLIKFKNDDMVFPKESAWFQKYDKNYNIEKLEESDFYKKDYLGIKLLKESGKVELFEFEGKHMQLTQGEIDKFVVPFLFEN